MKSRFLYVIFSFLALFSSYAGFGAQKAVFSSLSDELKIIEIHQPAKNLVFVSADESKIIGINERTLSRNQKKTENQNQFQGGLVFNAAKISSVKLPEFSDFSQSTFRVLLLPKSIKNIILLQTVI